MSKRIHPPAGRADTSPAIAPEPAPESDDSPLGRVRAVLERMRPAVQDDGGDVELIELTDDGVARIRLHGNCVGCPSSSMTLHMGIERNLRQLVPEVTGVEQVD
ncbi:MAG: NifU family protein [Planctomycetota bacterium]